MIFVSALISSLTHPSQPSSEGWQKRTAMNANAQLADQAVERATDQVKELDLASLNSTLEKKSAEERTTWALENFGDKIVLSSSFGAQSAVSLHMATRQWPDIPVILIDTGYLFPETYKFIDQLTKSLGLNLKVYQAKQSPAWQEARYGKLWEQGLIGIEKYNLINKVEPMNRALDELQADAWIAGLRRDQSESRSRITVLGKSGNRIKVHPILDWTDRKIFEYLKKHELPYHPLWDHGYVSIGDIHTTSQLTGDMTPEETRFFGLKRECGLHENVDYTI